MTGPGFLPTFLYYFISTSLIMTLVASEGLGVSISTGLPAQIGVVMGLGAGFLGGYFYQTVTVSHPCTDRRNCLNQITEALAQMGYVPVEDKEQTEDWMVYRRPFLRQIFSGKVYVQVEQSVANISSRSIHIKGLQKYLSDCSE